MKKILLLLLILPLFGCSTLAERGKVEIRIDPETGKEKKVYIPEEYMKITGQGSEADFSVHKIKSGKLLPDFPVEIDQ